MNVAHEEIDIHNPSKNHKTAGFLDIERIQFKEYLEEGYIDIFRKLNPDKEKCFTYWNILNSKTRINNSGWRIDYFLITNDVNANACNILNNIYGSDHCPIILDIL